MGLCVKPAVVAAECHLARDIICKVKVGSVGVGVLHVHVFARRHRTAAVSAVGRCDAGRNLAHGHVHQRNHAVQHVAIDGHRGRQSASAVFGSAAPVVALLCAEVAVAHIEEGGRAHGVEVAIVELLGGRRLEALAPSGSQAEVAERKHGAQFGCGAEAEGAVLVEAQSGRQVEPADGVQLVLHIEGSRPVVGRACGRAHGRREVVVAILGTCAQRIACGQAEDALQRHECPLLVALQVLLAGEVGIVVGEASQRVVAVAQGDVCVLVVVGMLVPVGIQREDASALRLPLATGRGRGVAVHQVVGIDIATGVTAVRGAANLLGVVPAFGIDLQSRGQLIAETLCQLPVGGLVHRLVAAVCEHASLGRLASGVLPAVSVAQLQVGVAFQACGLPSEALVVACLAVTGPDSLRGLVVEPLVAACLASRPARDDVHHSGHCIAAIESRLRTLHHLNALYLLRVYERKVVLSAHVSVYALAVYEYQHVGVAQSAQLHLAAHVALAEGKRSRQAAQYLLEAATSVGLQHAARDDLGLHRRIAEQTLRARTRHHHFAQSVRVRLSLSRPYHKGRHKGDAPKLCLSLHSSGVSKSWEYAAVLLFGGRGRSSGSPSGPTSSRPLRGSDFYVLAPQLNGLQLQEQLRSFT